ncbi:MAG: GntR family transcriptional regulator [Oscillibacter sp.]|jgi:DNA-binding GntR family transcriptional regulator|nr:GntR family transcriptional regulator [Oscillibacter sp.]
MGNEAQRTRESFSEKALRYLREQIINGQMPPQEKIVESEIAHCLGVSRGPVRDALKQLAVEGLVDYQPNRGCTVALLSPKDAYEVFYLRGSLEKLALEKGGGRISDEGLFRMEEAVEEIRAGVEKKSTSAVVAADEKFHRQIIESGRMDRLVKMWELLSPLNGAMFLVVKKTNELERRLGQERTLDDPFHGDDLGAHTRLLETCRRGDLQASLRALDAHYIRTGERIYRLSLRDELPEK